jgi:Uma2 family endonuclease
MALPKDETPPHFTYADYLTWPESERWEIIDGVAYNMTPAPNQIHQEMVGELHRQIANFLLDKPCRVFLAPFDVRLPKARENKRTTSTVVQPDVMVVCDPKRLDGKGVVGAPSLVVEITSPSTAAKDLREKRAVYERAGVPEYWILSPVEKVLQVYTLDAEGKYGAPAVYTTGDQVVVGVLPDLTIDLTRVFADR